MWTIAAEAHAFPDKSNVRKERGDQYYTLHKNGIDLYSEDGVPVKYAEGFFVLQDHRHLSIISKDKRMARDFTSDTEFRDEAEFLTEEDK